jgi:hypothetical protein
VQAGVIGTNSSLAGQHRCVELAETVLTYDCHAVLCCRDKYEVVVVSPRNYFLYTPLLPAVAVGTMEERRWASTQPQDSKQRGSRHASSWQRCSKRVARAKLIDV